MRGFAGFGVPTLLLAALSSASAATIDVISTAPGRGGSSCTLRDAIDAANLDAPVGACPAGSGTDTLLLAAGATYALTEVDNTADGPTGYRW
jgi:hypothetical protein